MRMARNLQIKGFMATLAASLVGCSSQTAAPPAPPTAAATESAQNNPAINQILKDPKTTSASADYIKTHMPPSSGQGNGR